MYFNKQIILVNNEASCYFIQFNDKFEYIYIYIYQIPNICLGRHY